MSYILDALLKADHERQRQQAPGLHAVLLHPLPAARRQRPWPLLAAGMAGGGLFLAWNYLAQPHLTPAPETLPLAPLAPLAPVAAGPETPALPVARRNPRREPLPDSGSPLPPRVARPGNRLYGIEELPPGLRQAARSLAVAGYAQAPDTGETMAIINDRAWREGEQMTEGLRVEKISGDGVVFNFKGYRFRKGGA